MTSSSTILCVDHKADFLSVRKILLETHGFKILTAYSADEAISTLKTQSVNLVLSEFLLPGTTGDRLAARIKQLRPETPVVLLSGIVEYPEKLEHADHIIGGDYTPEELFEELDLILGEFQSVSNPLSAISETEKRRSLAAAP